MTNFKLHPKQINENFCSSLFAAYMNSEWGIEVGYKVIPIELTSMNKELLDWQENSDCCALCNTSVQDQFFSIVSYGVLSTNPCPPLTPLFSGIQNAPCFVNQQINNQITNGTCCK